MNFVKKTICTLFVAVLTFGFVSCSDDDNDFIPEVKTEWTMKNMIPTITSDNDEAIKEIESELAKSTFMIKSITFSSYGTYESTFEGIEKGIYRTTNDSLYLTIKSNYDTNNNIIADKVYGFDIPESGKMNLSKDITDQFKDRYEDVEKVVITYNFEK